MTVRELIDHLSTLPPDLPVVYRCCSDWEELYPDEVTTRELSFRRGSTVPATPVVVSGRRDARVSYRRLFPR